MPPCFVCSFPLLPFALLHCSVCCRILVFFFYEWVCYGAAGVSACMHAKVGECMRCLHAFLSLYLGCLCCVAVSLFCCRLSAAAAAPPCVAAGRIVPHPVAAAAEAAAGAAAAATAAKRHLCRALFTSWAAPAARGIRRPLHQLLSGSLLLQHTRSSSSSSRSSKLLAPLLPETFSGLRRSNPRRTRCSR